MDRNSKEIYLGRRIELDRALSSPDLAQDIEELNQLLEAVLVKPASDKLTNLYTKAADSVLRVQQPRRQAQQ